jgi:hypothetical protein
MLGTVFAYFCFCKGIELGKAEGYNGGYKDGYEKGFDRAEEVYHIKPKEEEKEISTYIRTLQQKPAITAEMLMAYGVESTVGLPRDVRQSLGLGDYSEEEYLDSLLQEEVTNV